MFDLDAMKVLIKEMGFKTVQNHANILEVHIDPSVILEFCNLVSENDTLVGFKGTPWHYHGMGMFCSGQNTYIKLEDELELLIMLKNGDLLLFEKYNSGILQDRWLSHKDEPFEADMLEPEQEIRIRRLF